MNWCFLPCWRIGVFGTVPGLMGLDPSLWGLVAVLGPASQDETGLFGGDHRVYAVHPAAPGSAAGPGDVGAAASGR